MEHSKHPFVPAFDPDHKDEEILHAFADVCALRTRIQQIAEGVDAAAGADVDTLINRLDDEMRSREEGVFSNFASTPAGMVPRLALLLNLTRGEAWIDQAISSGAFLALYNAREKMDLHGEQLAQAIYELHYIEWDQAVAHYRRAAATFKALSRIAEAAHILKKEVGSDNPAMLKLLKLIDNEYIDSSPVDETRRLIHTIAPDPQELQNKLEIIMAEEWDEDVAPWIARDAKFLLGRIHGEAEKPAGVTTIKQAA